MKKYQEWDHPTKRTKMPHHPNKTWCDQDMKIPPKIFDENPKTTPFHQRFDSLVEEDIAKDDVLWDAAPKMFMYRRYASLFPAKVSKVVLLVEFDKVF